MILSEPGAEDGSQHRSRSAQQFKSKNFKKITDKINIIKLKLDLINYYAILLSINSCLVNILENA